MNNPAPLTQHAPHDAQSALPEWEPLSAKLKDFLSVYDEPIPSLLAVNTIPDAPICGGGKLTMALDGTHREVNYHLSKSDFWAIVLKPEALFQKFHIRQAPLCRLGLTVHNGADNTKGFQHVQDMSNAEIRSALPLEGGMLKVRSAALAQRDLVVYELGAVDTAASVTVRLETSNENENFFIINGVHDDATVWLRKEHTSFITVNAAAALRVLEADNVRTWEEPGTVALSFDVQPGCTTRLLLSIKGGKDEYHHLEEALDALDAAGPGDIDGLLDEHAAWWKAFWLKSWIDLHDSVLERFYYGAQYVHGCSIDLDARSVPGLAGGWITNDNPIWGGTYTMNYNGEAPFWGLMSSNRGEFILPYARVCRDYIPTGRKLAKRLGTKGMVMPVMIGPWGVEDNDDALGQKSNASLAAMSLIWHYEYTRDREFLEQYLYPYLMELMDFWEVNVVLDETGRYVIAESASRERIPGDLNPGPELGYLRRVLATAITCSEELGVDEARRVQWREILDRLSDYPTMEEDGGLCYMEAENRMEVSIQGVGDNPVVLDHVYPGGALDEDSTGKGRIIARNTLRYLDSWNQGNGFPRIFSQAVRAEWPGGSLLDIFKKRITSGEGPHEKLRCNNTFLPEDHSYEGNGSTEFINSMLAHAHGGVLKVFEVWPKERDASFRRIRVKDAFLVSGELKGGEVARVEILSEKGGACRMKSCWPGRAIEVEQIDGGAAVAVQREEGAYVWDTNPGEHYRVTAGEAVDEKVVNPPVMLVPVIESAARAKRCCTGAALDILLTPDVKSTPLEFDVVYADESRRRCTGECRFSSRNTGIADVSPDGVVSGGDSGRTYIDISAEVDGVELSFRVSVYVMHHHVITEMKATASGGKGSPWHKAHDLNCLLLGDGTDGPDITSLHRTNSYGVGLYLNEADEDGSRWIQFDLGTVHALDEMWVWNYNCPENYRVLWWNGGVAVGMRDVTIEYSEDGDTWTELKTQGHPFRLARATGKQWMPASNLDDGNHSPIRFEGAKARYVRLTPNPEIGMGNWGGERFGLAQVRFTRLPA